MTRERILLALCGVLLFAAGYVAGNSFVPVAWADGPIRASVPKTYGRLVAAIADSIGTGLIFEDSDGVIRFVSVTGMREGRLARY